MASHASEAGSGGFQPHAGQHVVDRGTAAGGRTLDQRMAGTRRLLVEQRMAFTLFAVASFVAAFL